MWCLLLDISDLISNFSIHRLCSSHIGLHSTPLKQRVGPCLQTFTFPVLSTWSTDNYTAPSPGNFKSGPNVILRVKSSLTTHMHTALNMSFTFCIFWCFDSWSLADAGGIATPKVSPEVLNHYPKRPSTCKPINMRLTPPATSADTHTQCHYPPASFYVLKHTHTWAFSPYHTLVPISDLFCSKSVRMSIIIKIRDDSCWRECGKKRTLVHFWWGCKLVHPLWNKIWGSL